jgi:hypothetical protein
MTTLGLRSVRSVVFFLAALLACLDAPAQVDRGQLEALYQDLRSSDWGTREKAFEAIQRNAVYLKDPETADRFLVLVDELTQTIKTRHAAGLDSEGWGEGMLEAAWELWKDRLTPPAFRVFASGIYGPDSLWAAELGTQAGRFVSAWLPLTNDTDGFFRENATALVGYALIEDRMGTIRLAPEDRAALRRALAAASADRSYGVRVAAVEGLKMERDVWALPVLEQMYEREPSFDPATQNRRLLDSLRGRVKEAIQAIRSRAAIASQDFDALQACYRGLRSTDPDVRLEAINALVKREDFLSSADTPDRLLRLLDLETRAIRGRPAPEKESSGRANPFYESLLAATWQAWKEKLSTYSFSILARAAYDPASTFAEELGSQAGRFSGVAVQYADRENQAAVRANGVLLLAYALAGDEKGTLRLTPDERRFLTQVMVRAAEDRNPTVRLAVVNALRRAGGAWTIPVLEQMDKREPQ